MPTLKTREPATDLSPAKQDLAVATKPSKLRKIRNGITHHPRLVQVAIFLTLISGTGLVMLYFLFRGAWPKHEDNTAILNSILKMELNRENIQTIDGDNQRVITRTFSSLEPAVEADGWTWINRFGSTITYGKQDRRLIASCSPYSPLYIICDLSEIP